MGEKVQKRACEKLSETIERKEEEPERKRSRKGGNDTIEFLRGKENRALKTREREGNSMSDKQAF